MVLGGSAHARGPPPSRPLGSRQPSDRARARARFRERQRARRTRHRIAPIRRRVRRIGIQQNEAKGRSSADLQTRCCAPIASSSRSHSSRQRPLAHHGIIGDPKRVVARSVHQNTAYASPPDWPTLANASAAPNRCSGGACGAISVRRLPAWPRPVGALSCGPCTARAVASLGLRARFAHDRDGH